MSELVQFNDLLENNTEIQPLMDVVQQIMELPDDSLTDTTVESMIGAINGAFTPAMQEKAIQEFIRQIEEEGLNTTALKYRINEARNSITSFIDELHPSEKKRAILNGVFSIFYNLFDSALERYHKYDIELPIQLEEGAQVPTYAHENDAAADLYAADTVVVPAHSHGNMICTGVHIQLPENWVAFIFPRSSIGSKTPLRLSNSVGIIDCQYRGPLGVLYDNLSDSDYTINAGDRIAQLMVMPNYHFKAKVVDKLEESERGDGGFGSSGK